MSWRVILTFMGSMKKIYTKTGDKGLTSLKGGTRVPKDDLRIEANGQLDQLNACLGMARSMMRENDSQRQLLYRVQRELMTIMSHVATPEGMINPRQLHTEEITQLMEQAIDGADSPAGFVIPGDGGLASACLHVARAQARTAERRLWTLHRLYPVHEGILMMVNRLSDYLFVLAIAYEER